MEVLLTIAMLFADKPTAVYREPMPSVQICLQEAEKFLNGEWPEALDAKEIHADCGRPNPHEKKT